MSRSLNTQYASRRQPTSVWRAGVLIALAFSSSTAGAEENQFNVRIEEAAPASADGLTPKKIGPIPTGNLSAGGPAPVVVSYPLVVTAADGGSYRGQLTVEPFSQGAQGYGSLTCDRQG